MNESRSAALDGLRGIAILSVLFVHWAVQPFAQFWDRFLNEDAYEALRFGVHGVDIFFAISGFLIARIILRQQAKDGFIFVFIGRRAMRILPMYFLCLIVFSALFRVPEPAEMDLVPTWAFVVFLNNIYQAYLYETLYAFEPYWSLAIEEHFYFSAAIVALLGGRNGVKGLALVFLIGGVGLRVAIWFFDVEFSSWRFTLSHGDPIALGMLLALYLDGKKEAVRSKLPPICWAGILAALVVMVFVGRFLEVLRMINVSILAAGLLSATTIYLLETRSVNFLSFLNAKVLVLSGRACFSLYLIHQGFFLIWIALGDRLGMSAPLSALSGLPMMFILCAVSWRYIEEPFISLGHRLKYRQPVPLVAN